MHILKGCLSTHPRLEGTVQAAGLKVLDTRVHDQRRPLTETIVLASASSAVPSSIPSYMYLGSDCRRLTGTIYRRHDCLGEDWQIALARPDSGERRLWISVNDRSLKVLCRG